MTARREPLSNMAAIRDNSRMILLAIPACAKCGGVNRVYSTLGRVWYLKCSACGHNDKAVG